MDDAAGAEAERAADEYERSDGNASPAWPTIDSRHVIDADRRAGNRRGEKARTFATASSASSTISAGLVHVSGSFTRFWAMIAAACVCPNSRANASDATYEMSVGVASESEATPVISTASVKVAGQPRRAAICERVGMVLFAA